MIEVIPAVLAKDFQELQNSLERYINLSSMVQIDICDGVFVPSVSWPYNEIKTGNSKNLDAILREEQGLPYWDRMNFELDLMVKDASAQFELFMRLGPKRIVFHIEAEMESHNDITRFKEFLEGIDMYTREHLDIGVAINTTTDINIIAPIIYNIDFVQCMGIARDGFQGEDFDERAISQIKSLRAKYRELIISVDGAVDEDTAPRLVDAGANRLVVGSFLVNSIDLKEAIGYLENLQEN